MIIPVYYQNEPNIPELLTGLNELVAEIGDGIELIFVVDESPGRSLELLLQALPNQSFPSQLIVILKNFGSFAAMWTTTYVYTRPVSV